MRTYYVNSSKKGQLKIQEMAFVLVALMIFFGMFALIFFNVRLANLKKDVTNLREEETKALITKFVGTPELAWTSSKKECYSCIDFDKAMVLKNRQAYKGFWNLDYLMIEKVYPLGDDVECNNANYPNCRTLTIINKSVGNADYAYVSLCRWESKGYVKCEMGKIYASGIKVE